MILNIHCVIELEKKLGNVFYWKVANKTKVVNKFLRDICERKLCAYLNISTLYASVCVLCVSQCCV